MALRDFEFGEIIMAERCVAGSPEEIGELEPASVLAAAMLLVSYYCTRRAASVFR